MDRNDAFDVLTDEQLTARTTFLKRNFALLLAAQNVNDKWFSYNSPKELAEAIKSGEFDPAEELTRSLLEYSGSIDAKTLDVFRDVGVGAPQMGIAGIGAPLQNQSPQVANKPESKGVFRR